MTMPHAAGLPGGAAGAAITGNAATDRAVTDQAGAEPAGRKDEKAKAMALVAMAANFGKELPEPLFALWLDLLRPYPAALVAEAVKTVVLHYEYKTLPPFAVVRKALDDLYGSGARSLGRQATAEWAALLDLIGKRGRYNPPESLHPTTVFVLKVMGGWRAACSWTEESLEFRRRDFISQWTECHGNVDAMSLGAAGMRPALAARREKASPVAGGIRALLEARQPDRAGEGA